MTSPTGLFTDHETKAIVLLSGGLDSATTLHIAIERCFRPVILTFDYGQRHAHELEAAKKIAIALGCRDHAILRIDPGLFRGSALVGGEIDVPRGRVIDESIPVTYVPARNILFLSHALALAESLAIHDIFVGVNSLDYSGYPDCRAEFLEAFERMAALGTKTGSEGRPVKIHAPLIHMTKAEIIREGLRLGCDYSLTSSCYDPAPDGEPCGLCDSCRLRQRGFAEAGKRDPLLDRYYYS